MRSRITLFAALLLLLIGGGLWWMKREAPPPTAQVPVSPAEPVPAPVPAPIPTQAPATPHGPAGGPPGDNPLNWPLMVPVGPDGNAVPLRSGALQPAPRLTAPALRRASLSATRMQPEAALFRPAMARDMVILARGKPPTSGPVKLEPSGPGTHYITPPGGGGKGYGASPGGGSAKSDTGGLTSTNGDGSIDYRDDKGQVWLDPPEADGSRYGWTADPKGNIETIHLLPDGTTETNKSNGDVERSNPDGSVTTKHPDGSVETVDRDGNRSIDIDGMLPSTTGPGGNGEGGTGPGGKGARGIGEPHFLTADGTGFTTQSLGEFVLATGIADQELQIRTGAYNGSRSVSAITGFAISAGGETIQLLLDGTVRIDGALAEVSGSPLRYDLREGGALGLWKDGDRLAHAVVIWPDLSTLWIEYHNGFMSFSVKWREGRVDRIGLLGSEDGTPGNDLSLRGGTEANADDPAAVTAFVNDWRVSDEESLFSYPDDQSTLDFTDADFPYAPAEEAHKELAESLCAGLAHDFTRLACLFDVAVTGEADFAAAAAAMDRQLSFEATAAQPAAPLGVPGACRAEGDDVSTAKSPDGDRIVTTTSTDRSEIYRITTSGGIAVMTRAESSYSGPWVEGQPGYCVFAESGETVIPLTSSGSDSSFSRGDQSEIPGGTYYLKISGEGESNLTLTLPQ